MTELTEKDLDHLRHMLGINTPTDKHPKPYRDYAAVNPHDKEWLRLESLGMVRRYRTVEPHSPYNWYTTTDEGKARAIASHKNIRQSRSKRRYSAYLDVSDTFSELKFIDFLTDPQFKQTRDEA